MAIERERKAKTRVKSGKHATANTKDAVLMGSLAAAKFLGIGINVLTRESAAGNIPAFKIGGKWVFSKPALEAWIVDKLAERNT
jgi:Helix-turn-helix domain